MLQSCAKSVGVKITQDSVANPQLMPKVLQELSSHTLPDLLMLDNPNLQQIAQTGALTPLSTAGVTSAATTPRSWRPAATRARSTGSRPA
jgi:multiple sugar transport system substrate-binding protein